MENPLNWLEVLSIVSSLVSVVIGGLAIWLAVKFYEMSSKSSDKLEQASNNIDSTTKRLETLFDKLYADTFAMVKDTVSDMRKHVWKVEETGADVADVKLEQLKQELLSEVAENFDNTEQQDEIQELKKNIKELLNKAVDRSANISKEALEDRVLVVLKELGEYGRKVNYEDVFSYLDEDEEKDIASALFSLRNKGKIAWGDRKNKGSLSSEDNIVVTQLGNS